jgi:hypothetical protein
VSDPLCLVCHYWVATVGDLCEACTTGPRWIGGDEFPHADVSARWDEYARWQAAALERALTGSADPEWSSEQTFHGEFGFITQFGDPID